MTRFSNNYQAVDEDYQALAALPLPEAAAVLDIRQRDDDALPLLDQLNTELTDLATEMRAHHVTHWSHLRDCIVLLRLDAFPGDLPLGPDTHYRIKSPDGAEQAMLRQEYLVSVLGSEYIDQVRSTRVNASDTTLSTPVTAGVKQSTVRVFLLADMREPASLTRAATYAHWLKAWSEREHGRSRRYRDEHLHTVILCLNANASYQDVLLQMLGKLPDSAVDTVILLQKYSDDDAIIDETAQLVKAELLLYTLILRWPDVLWKRIDDPVQRHPRFIATAQTLPWPTFLVGLSAFEYSARWSARWLDYSVTGAILKTLNDEAAIEQEQSLLASAIRKWQDDWQRDLQTAVPGMLVMQIKELQGITALDGLIRTVGLYRGKLLDAPGKLDVLRTRAGQLYTGTEAATLQLAIEKGPQAILDQLRQRAEQIEHAERTQQTEQSMSVSAAESVVDDAQSELDEPYHHLMSLRQQLQRLLGLHFKDAEGAVPRGLIQLAAFQKHAEKTIAATANQPVKFNKFQQEFEQEAKNASDKIMAKFKTWRLPFVGRVFRSTIISLVVALAIAFVLLLAIDWSALLADLPLSPLVLLWVTRALIVLLVLGGEWLYLAKRNRSLRRLFRSIEASLRRIIEQHLAAVTEAIAARVGLDLMKQANLYTSDKATSPYEYRLQAFARASRKGLEIVQKRRTLAEARLGVDSQENISLPSWAAPSQDQARVEFIDWSLIEETFLESHKALPFNPLLNMLAEMLIRQLGTERPHALLEQIWEQKRWISGKDKEARFQVLSALLVAHLLAATVAEPPPAHLAELLSAMQEYTELKKLYIEDRAFPEGDALDLPAVVKQAMLIQAHHGQAVFAGEDSEQQSISALISWVNAQHEHLPRLQEMFAVSNLLEHLISNRMQPSRILSDLYGKGTLLGRPDEISGEDAHYLFVAQGNEIAYSMFMEALHNVNERRVQVMSFPDREKLIYLRIHRALQFFSEEVDAAGMSQDGSDRSQTAVTGSKPAHQEG